MPTHITVAEARRTSGVTSTLVSDADVSDTIDRVEATIPKFLNTTLVPEQRIDILDGNDTVRIILNKNPVLSVRALEVDDTAVTVSKVKVYPQSGKLWLDSADAPEVNLFRAKPQAVVCKYYHGLLEESTTTTTTTGAVSAGSSVSVSVSSSSGLTANDWVRIVGMDGNDENAIVSSVDDGTTITLDFLGKSHESGSIITLLQVPTNIKRLIEVVVSLALVARVVGQSFDDITAYTLGELSVQKGEPYTQWRETANQLMRERDELLRNIQNRPSIK